MQPVIEILQSVGVLFAGLLARFGLFLAMLAMLVLPALAIALAMRAISACRERALGLRRVAGVLFRPDLFYAPGHTWLRRRRASALELGIDDLAQRLLPSVSAVELPRPGAEVARGETVAVLHGGGRAIRILAPVAGTIAGVNASVLRDPALVKREGYGRGWLVAIVPADPSFALLPHGEQAEGWLRREAARWSRFFEERLGFAAADGGELVSPAPWLVGEEGWKALTAAFLES
ncbi:MAG TPA: glycine cleavage system protein H [Anaeromyxobacter sp.]